MRAIKAVTYVPPRKTKGTTPNFKHGIDVDKMRLETPALMHQYDGASVRRKRNTANSLHFNACGAALQPSCVIRAMTEHLTLEGMIGGYEAEEAASSKIDATYTAIAKLLTCAPEEVALMDNATRGWHAVFTSFTFEKGDVILTSPVEYGSNYMSFLRASEVFGVEIRVLPHRLSGLIDVANMKSAIDDKVKLIAVTHVPTNCGVVNPIKEIGQLAHEHGIPFLVDASQSVGQIPINVKECHIDFLSASGRKFLRGPRGTGFLYVRKEWWNKLHPKVVDVRSATWTSVNKYEFQDSAKRFETWETNVAANVALGVAVDYAVNIGIDKIHERCTSLASQLAVLLHDIDELEVLEPGEEARCGIVSFTCIGMDNVNVVKRLKRVGTNVLISRNCFTMIQMRELGLESVIRVGIHYYNTPEELYTLSRQLGEIVSTPQSDDDDDGEWVDLDDDDEQQPSKGRSRGGTSSPAKASRTPTTSSKLNQKQQQLLLEAPIDDYFTEPLDHIPAIERDGSNSSSSTVTSGGFNTPQQQDLEDLHLGGGGGGQEEVLSDADNNGSATDEDDNRSEVTASSYYNSPPMAFRHVPRIQRRRAGVETRGFTSDSDDGGLISETIGFGNGFAGAFPPGILRRGQSPSNPSWQSSQERQAPAPSIDLYLNGMCCNDEEIPEEEQQPTGCSVNPLSRSRILEPEDFETDVREFSVHLQSSHAKNNQGNFHP